MTAVGRSFSARGPGVSYNRPLFAALEPGNGRPLVGPRSICCGAGRLAVSKQYKIADACRLLDIQPYVLRYWQTEFRVLAPKKGGGERGDFSAGDLETIRRIKELLYDEGYTIASAKKKIAAELEDGRLRGQPPMPVPEDEPEGGEPPTEAVEEAAEAKASREAEEAGAAEAADEAGKAEDAGEAAEAVQAEDAGEAGEAEEAQSPGAKDLSALTSRVERLERGVAALVGQARQLAAELGPEGSAETD